MKLIKKLRISGTTNPERSVSVNTEIFFEDMEYSDGSIDLSDGTCIHPFGDGRYHDDDGKQYGELTLVEFDENDEIYRSKSLGFIEVY